MLPALTTQLSKLFLIAISLGLGSLSVVAQALEVKVWYVGATTGSVWQGVQQGLEEANQLGQFTDQHYYLKQLGELPFIKQLDSQRPLAILAALDAEKLRSLIDRTVPLLIPVFNLTAEDDALRQDCLSYVFHIIPSRRMKADALAQWYQRYPQTSVTAQAWHPNFKKFAAGELNNRFRKAHGFAMDDHAWAGWAAMKLLADGVARIQNVKSQRVLWYLSQEMEFDAQKGMPSSFRDTGQMRQILLLIEDGKPVEEAPVQGVVDVADLDSLGLSSCP